MFQSFPQLLPRILPIVSQAVRVAILPNVMHIRVTKADGAEEVVEEME